MDKLATKIEGRFFEKSDLIPIIAALVDSTLIGIGLVVTILWLSTIKVKPPHVDSSTWIPSSPSAAALVKPTTTILTSHSVVVTVCTLFVDTHFASRPDHYVEFRGNCNALRSIAARSKTPVRWLAPQQMSYTVTGP